MSTVLYRKYRPQRFADIRGQDAVTSILVHAIASGQVNQAYLFAGPRGTGKTSTARLFAKAVNTPIFGKQDRDQVLDYDFAEITDSLIDLIEVDAASNRGIDEIRQLKDSVSFLPAQGKFKVYIIDEVHMLTREAFNALLKTLEEPPAHAIFILATTEPHKIPPTILSRVQRHNFRFATEAELIDKLSAIISAEGWEVEPAVLSLLYRHAEGSYRDAESLLSKLLHTQSQTKLIQLSEVEQLLGLASLEAIEDIIKAIAEGNTKQVSATLSEVFSAGVFPSQLMQQIIYALRDKVHEAINHGQPHQDLLGVLRKIIGITGELRNYDNDSIVVEVSLLSLCKDNVSDNEPDLLASPKIPATKKSQRAAAQVNTPSVRVDQESPVWDRFLTKVKHDNFTLWTLLRAAEYAWEPDILTVQVMPGKLMEMLQEAIEELIACLQSIVGDAATIELIALSEDTNSSAAIKLTRANTSLVEAAFNS